MRVPVVTAGAALAVALAACGGSTATLSTSAPPNGDVADGQSPPDVPLPSQAGQTVVLHHCGVQHLEHDGEQWEVEDPPFDLTNAPAGFSGFGELERDGDVLRYVDHNGARLVFTLDDGVDTRICA